jgi:hypothetical protein
MFGTWNLARLGEKNSDTEIYPVDRGCIFM